MMFLVEATALRRSCLRAGPNHRALHPDPHLQHILLHSTRSTRSWTIRACSAGNSSFQTVAKSALRRALARATSVIAMHHAMQKPPELSRKSAKSLRSDKA
jgi:hypothetical protein